MAVSSVSNQKTIQDIIDSTAKSANDRNTGALGKDDFINLLVTQLKYQDPLNPTDDKEFIGQMAQFSALEQMQNVGSGMTQANAYSMIGKNITAQITDDTTYEVKTVEGTVTSVKTSSGKTYVVVKGQEIPVEKVTNVSQSSSAAESNLAAYTNLIGYNIDGVAYNSSTGDMVSVNGNVREIQKGQYENYAMLDGVKVTVSGIVSDTHSTDAGYITGYLDAHGEAASDHEVTVYITDSKHSASIPVTAKLKSFNKATDGTITAVLDEMAISVDSVMGIKPKVSS